MIFVFMLFLLGVSIGYAIVDGNSAWGRFVNGTAGLNHLTSIAEGAYANLIAAKKHTEMSAS
jgi:hypothetical protein